MRLKADLLLLLAAVIWGGAFVVQRVAAQHVGPFLFNAARFLLAVIVILPIVRRPLWKLERNAFPWIGLGGSLLFVASVLQQAGLRWTTAANAGFITSLYVIIVPLLLLFFWKQHLPWINWIAAFVAVAGVKLLSSPGQFHLAPGDGLQLAGSLLWALHVILVSRVVKHMNALQFSLGQYLVCGLLNLVAALFLDLGTLGGLVSSWWAVVYGGALSIAVGFTFQVIGQKYAPPTDAALILSLEAVFAALFGYLFLFEGLEPIQVLGCSLILAAVAGVQIWGSKRQEKQKNLVVSPGFKE